MASSSGSFAPADAGMLAVSEDFGLGFAPTRRHAGRAGAAFGRGAAAGTTVVVATTVVAATVVATGATAAGVGEGATAGEGAGDGAGAGAAAAATVGAARRASVRPRVTPPATAIDSPRTTDTARTPVLPPLRFSAW
jgi:hypothetical protein